MSAAKHTPGPWHVGRGLALRIVYDKDGWAVASAAVFHNRFSENEDLANALLIAEAPDMLKALQELADAAQDRENPMGDPCALLAAQANLRDATKRARAAIAKAIGSEL